MISKRPVGHGGDFCSVPGERGVAMILALTVMMMVTLSIGILEMALQRSLEASRLATTKVQADFAAFGGAVKAAVNPPDSFSQYDYYGTRVQVTVLDPPLSLVEVLMEKDASAAEGTLRLLQSASASPSESSSAESMWYFLVVTKEHPEIRMSWPGILRQQPYE